MALNLSPEEESWRLQVYNFIANHDEEDMPEGWHRIWYDYELFFVGEPFPSGFTGYGMRPWLTATGYGWTPSLQIPLDDEGLEVWRKNLTHDDCLRQLEAFTNYLSERGFEISVPPGIVIPDSLELKVQS